MIRIVIELAEGSVGSIGIEIEQETAKPAEQKTETPKSNNERATWRQLKTIFGLAKARGIAPNAMRALARAQLGHGLSEASKADATRVIYSLLASAGTNGTNRVPA